MFAMRTIFKANNAKSGTFKQPCKITKNMLFSPYKKANLNTHPNSLYGLKISENLFGSNNNLVEIPLYAIEAWLRVEIKL